MKKYSFISNLKYTLTTLWDWDRKQFILFIIEGVMQSLSPFLGMLLPSVIIYLLNNNYQLIEIITWIIIVFIGSGIMNSLASFLKQNNEMQYVRYRVEYLEILHNEHLATTDLINIEADDKQKLLKKAVRSISSNWVGPEIFLRNLVIFITNIISIALYCLVIGNINIIIIVLLAAISLLNYFTYQKAYKVEYANKDERSRLYRKSDYLANLGFNIKTGKDIRIYQLQNWLSDYYNIAINKLLVLTNKEKKGYFLVDLISLVLQLLRDGICYGYLIYLLMQGLDISLFILYISAISGFSAWFTKIIDNVNILTRSSVEIGDFRIYYDLPNELLHNEGIKLGMEEKLEVVFENVSFAYPGSNKYVIKDMNLKIKNGEKLALVGINGAGKTTIVKLICGLYKPTSGRILINGIDLGQMDIDDYLNHVAAIFQDSLMLAVDIYKNVAVCEDELIDIEKVKHCCKVAGISEKIESLDNGYETYLFKNLDKNGVQLSGGEQQKLLLARALYKGGRLLILDEPTAALDAISESEMYENYRDLTIKKTSLFISHRLASTRFCDRIIFLENGQISEEGTHDELMSLNGAYANMYEVQSKYYKENPAEGELEYDF